MTELRPDGARSTTGARPPRFGPVDRRVDGSQAHPFEPSRGDGRMTVTDLFGGDTARALQDQGWISFQATGDTGVDSTEQRNVACAMSHDLDPHRREKGPLFFLNLGDVIYGPGKTERYANHFYRPYLEYIHTPVGYDAAILAIPGNHDGEVRSAADAPSLGAFRENFCQPSDSVPPMARSFGVTMPDQPGAYFWLDAPWLDLIGLYSNAKEDEGLLGADGSETHQRTWLLRTLSAIKAGRGTSGRKALVMAVHHPPFARGLNDSGPGHPGSSTLLAQMDEACQGAGLWPDVVLSGHAHNYQRYMRAVTVDGNPAVIAYFVAGTGGIGLQEAPTGIGQQRNGVVYANGLTELGYLRVTADASSVTTAFVQARGTHRQLFESIRIDLASRQPVPLPAVVREAQPSVQPS